MASSDMLNWYLKVNGFRWPEIDPKYCAKVNKVLTEKFIYGLSNNSILYPTVARRES